MSKTVKKRRIYLSMCATWRWNNFYPRENPMKTKERKKKWKLCSNNEKESGRQKVGEMEGKYKRIKLTK